MSRRITFFALAVSATLIATQASADRECFEDSCRHSETAEPATSSLPSPAVDGDIAAEASAAVDANAAAPKLAPARALPQVVATPEAAPVKVIAAPVPRPPVQSFADHELARLAPRSLKPAPAPVRVTNAVPEDEVRAEPALPPDPNYRPRRAMSAPGRSSPESAPSTPRTMWCGSIRIRGTIRLGRSASSINARAISAAAAPTAIIRMAPTAIGPTAPMPPSAALRFI